MVILVDEHDNEIGTMEKMEAHVLGKLHRAFSVVIFNAEGQMLLQKRADGKYHSAGLWTNACCSHPKPGEPVVSAASRRLKEEMGIEVHPTFAYKFIYRAELDHNLVEHEYDHVFIGTFNGKPEINLNEVSDWKYVDVASLKRDVIERPNEYTAWFKMIIEHPSAVASSLQ